MAANAKCLLISNIFPPIHGGSAVVYENLARFGEHRVVVLAPYRHYQSGYALVGCTVVPGFEFEDFEMPPRDDLLALYPNLYEFIVRLSR